jgi:aldehyde dehydrogenase (NAD+)
MGDPAGVIGENMNKNNIEMAPALEDKSFFKPRARWRGYVNGEMTDGQDGETFETTNPSNGEILGEVSRFKANDVPGIITGAREGMREWQDMLPGARAETLYRVSRIMQERSREFAVTETLDNGKPIRETRDVDTVLAAEWFFSHAGWADKLKYVGMQNPVPVGLVGAVIPWNFPLLMASWKLAPALAAGCGVILKPAETTPLTAILLADVMKEAGVPAGCVQIVPGYGDMGEAICRADVDKIAFTGSTSVGRKLREIAGGRPITLELGGKGANIIYDDADLDAAVDGIVWSVFYNQGHVCCAGTRLLVQENVYGLVREKLNARLKSIRVGDPMDKNTDMGAINSLAQRKRITDLIQSAEADGAEIVQGSCLDSECYLPPTVIYGVAPSMRVWNEEIFGPVLSVSTFRTAEEAVAMSNHTRYGLANGVWTSDGARANWTASRLRSGVVWINNYNLFDPTAPFGGTKESGWGREGGSFGMRAYLREGN